MNKHFVILPDGQKATRNSKNRVYTHCVATVPSYEYELMRAKQLVDVDRDNFNFYVREAGPDAKYASGWGPNGRYDFEGEELEAYRAEHIAKLRGATTAGEYQKLLIEDRVASVEAAKAKGYYWKWRVAGWNGRYDLAEKLAASERAYAGNAKVVILEAQRA